jgi:hypothetical protein
LIGHTNTVRTWNFPTENIATASEDTSVACGIIDGKPLSANAKHTLS